MPVTVSLEALVSIPGTRGLWPAEFDAFVRKIEAEPNDKTVWGVAADWLDEPGVDEPELAAAFRWVYKRLEVEVHSHPGGPYQSDRVWDFKRVTLPQSVRNTLPGGGADTPAGLAAKLAVALRKLREEVV